MNVYEIITEKIMKKLEQGEIPWRTPWKAGGWPKNIVSGKKYRGVNVFMLAMQGYASPHWLTYKQAKELGGYVKEGATGTPVVFWKPADAKKPDVEPSDDERRAPILRYYTVFNLSQVEGIASPDAELDRQFNPIEACERIVREMPDAPMIECNRTKAGYIPSEDKVIMPPPGAFVSDEDYYATLFHELTHSTGHENRLNRRPSTDKRKFGDEAYSKEELVAEMGAAFLCGIAGIETATVDNSAAYIQNWLTALKDDKRMVIFAAAAAQKAADYILNNFVAEQAKAA